MGGDTKRCPYCGEEIKAAAKKCWHCGEFLTEGGSADVRQNAPTETNTGTYVDDSSLADDMRGCGVLLGIFAVIIVAVVMLLHFTVPSDKRVERAIEKDMYSCVKDEVSSYSNLLDSDFSALADLVMNTSVSEETVKEAFSQYNEVKIDKSFMWTTGKIVNRNSVDGETVCFGILGIVIPFVTWDDFVLTDESNE